MLSSIDTFSSILAPIFYKLVYMSVIASIVGLVVVVVNQFLIRKISPRGLSIIWLTFLLTLLIPCHISTIFSIYNYIPEKILILNTEIENIKEVPYQQQYDSEKYEYINSEETISKEELLESMNHTYHKYLFFDVILPYLWFIISLILIMIYFLSYIIFDLKTKRNICSDKRLLEILERCKRELNIKKDIELVYQDRVKIPAIFGIFHVRILINESLESVTENKIEYIFMHELSHYKRRDNLFIILVMCIKSIYFFNPVIYIMLKELIKDIECATDEIAIKNMSMERKKEYAKTLLEFTEINHQKFVAKALCISDNKKNLEKRIIMIKNSAKFEKHKISVVLLSVTLVIVMILVFCTTKISNHTEEFDFSKLEQYENTYVAEYSDVKEIVTLLPFGSLSESMIVGSSEKTLLINYDMLQRDMKVHSLVLFTLIEDLEKIEYTFRNQNRQSILRSDFPEYSIKSIDGVIHYLNSDLDFGNSSAYDVTVNQYFDRIFQDQNLAFRKFKKDYKEELRVIQEEFSLLPLSNWNYKEYKEAAYSMDEKRYEKIYEFFEIYDNHAYVSKNIVKYPMRKMEVEGGYKNSNMNLQIIGNHILSNYFESFAIDTSRPNLILQDGEVIAGDKDEFVVRISYELLAGKYDGNLIEKLGKIDSDGWVKEDVMLRIKRSENAPINEDGNTKYELIEIGSQVSTESLEILNNSKILEKDY
ncbi:MAG: M56 family metallopeptidase [Clostridia bacterium]|nr:M56 family metallopeptidase [Clostridia bacterium]